MVADIILHQIKFLRIDLHTVSLREHLQIAFVTLSGFWPLRGWGSLSESIKKGIFMDENLFFQIC